jgi:prolipoprotein diacylglyceryltransferase
MGLAPNIESFNKMYYFHPTFLYESLWNIAGFVLINALYKKKKFDGQVFFMYIAWYGFGRMFIEGLRTDSLYVGPIRISQLVGLVCFIVGTAVIVVNLIRAKKRAANECCVECATVTDEQSSDSEPEEQGE